MSSRTKSAVFWVLLLVALVAALVYWLGAAGSSAQAYAIKSASLDRADMQVVVSASGSVTPIGSVSVGSQVSGQVNDVLVDFNETVKANQVLARLDASSFEQKVRQAQADLDAAKAQVQVQLSLAGARQADLTRARLNYADARLDLARKKDLLAKGFISTAERDRALTVSRTRRQDRMAAQAALKVIGAQTENARAIVAQREAGLASAQVNFDRATIRSPIDGVVIQRKIDAGQTVAASLSAPELFVIARNLTDMRVEASVGENDIGQVKPNMDVTFSVDAYPNKEFKGKVDQVRLSAENEQNVVTYTVLINFSNPLEQLLPGMTANVQIITAKIMDTLRIPNAALRIRAPKEILVAGSAATTAASQAPQPTATGRGRVRARMMAYRQRLIDTVNPNADQIEQINQVMKKAGARFRTLQGAQPSERAVVVKQIRASIRQEIGQVLTEDQQLLWREANDKSKGIDARAYGVQGDRLNAINFKAGISDGNFTQVVSGLDGSEIIAVSVKKSAEDKKDGSLRLLRLFR